MAVGAADGLSGRELSTLIRPFEGGISKVSKAANFLRQQISYNSTICSSLITQSITNNQTNDRKARHLKQSELLIEQARVAIEDNGDWQLSGGLILQALAEERKAESTGLQVMNVIKYRPKTKLEFNFRS